IAKTGATLIHSFENEDVMAGQGTAAVELLEEVPDLDVVTCPVGGGGLLCGTVVAAKTMRPKIKVIAAEPANADDAAESFRAGRTSISTRCRGCSGSRAGRGESCAGDTPASTREAPSA